MANQHDFAGIHCTVRLARRGPEAIVMRIVGRDIGEHGDAPMKALSAMLPAGRQLELFIDAREASGPTTDVSGAWAQWLAENKQRFGTMHMLTGTRFLQITATFVRKYAELGEQMRIYTDPGAFDAAMVAS